MAIIGLNGYATSGKDEVARIIQDLQPEKNWQIKKFSGRLKQIASILTNIPVEMFEDQEFKKSNLGDKWGMTVREFCQKLGTEAIRNGLHTNAWVNSLMSEYYNNTSSMPIVTHYKDPKFNNKRGRRPVRIFSIYNNMKQRCTNSNHPRYKDYGGRSIIVHEPWLTSFEEFKYWAYTNGYSDELTLDRIDNDGSYNPLNCRWVSSEIQNSNQRVRKDNTSGCKGVSFEKGKWRTKITYNNSSKFLGYFESQKEATEVYQKAYNEREIMLNTIAKAQKYSSNNFLITDCRFENEALAIKQNGGIIIRIDRSGVKPINAHASETALDNWDFDYKIANVSDLVALRQSVENLLNKIA